MADAITIKALQDASLDAKSLEEVVNGNEAKQVTTRKGETYPSVKKAIKTLFENGGLPATPFKTKALMTASTLVDGDYAVVTDDTDENNGIYIKEGGVWVKSKYNLSELIGNKLVIRLNSLTTNGDFSSNYSWPGTPSLDVEINNSVLRLTYKTGQESGNISLPPLALTAGDKHLFYIKYKVNSKGVSANIGRSIQYYEEGSYITLSTGIASEWNELLIVRTVPDSPPVTAQMFLALVDDRTGDEINAGGPAVLEIDTLEVFNVTKDVGDTIPNEVFYREYIRASSVIRKSDNRNSYELSVSTAVTLDGFRGFEHYTTSTETLWSEGDTTSDGAVDGISGQIIEGGVNNYKHTGFLDISNYKELVLSGFVRSNLSYAFYNSDYEPIKVYKAGAVGGIIPVGFVVNGRVRVPVDAVYFAKTISDGTVTETNATIEGVVDLLKYHNETLLISDDDELVAEPYNYKPLAGNIRSTDGRVTYADDPSYRHIIIPVDGYDGIVLKEGSYNKYLYKTWFDEHMQAVVSLPVGWNLGGYLSKPRNAKYLLVNIQDATNIESNLNIKRYRQVNSSDFSRKGVSGDASMGWGVTTDTLQTQKMAEFFNPHNPDVKPLKIYHAGIQPDYNYGDRIAFDTEIARVAWGIQIAMNASRPNLPDDLHLVKSLKNQNALVAEWGVEGFSWHVSPGYCDWGNRDWMTLKIGGSGPRTDSSYSYARGTQVQSFVPTWSERTDAATGKGVAKNNQLNAWLK